METYSRRIYQEELQYIYESAHERMKLHPDYTRECKGIVNKCTRFEKEKDALEFTINECKNNNSNYQIWADVEKTDDIYRITDCWYVANDNRTKQALEYLGMAQMYDYPRILRLINDNVDIQDIIAYY